MFKSCSCSDGIIFDKLVFVLYFPYAASRLPNPNSVWEGGGGRIFHALSSRSFTQRHVHKLEFYKFLDSSVHSKKLFIYNSTLCSYPMSVYSLFNYIYSFFAKEKN